MKTAVSRAFLALLIVAQTSLGADVYEATLVGGLPAVRNIVDGALPVARFHTPSGIAANGAGRSSLSMRLRTPSVVSRWPRE